MRLDSELRTLLYLQKTIDVDFSSTKTLLILKLIMAALIMVCVLSFMLVLFTKLSSLIAIPLVAICGLFVGYISYYIRSIEIWPHYRPHFSKDSLEKRILEIQNQSE